MRQLTPCFGKKNHNFHREIQSFDVSAPKTNRCSHKIQPIKLSTNTRDQQRKHSIQCSTICTIVIVIVIFQPLFIIIDHKMWISSLGSKLQKDARSRLVVQQFAKT